ncbi:hypothetical protein MCSF7_00376 [Mycoplasmopsis columbina SF7]|uniref:Lipoprotein n=1 Tax=Mycoplasmopsis columbina SF7 TaxID=1037410 RepID=F9UJM9_9BACT|nr:hypothetical protein [Mycoplasmopsis columbina]EGV00410.1 hypothetical protein MCSF7_00376 [Mycoplasmopsis columbina SF7]
MKFKKLWKPALASSVILTVIPIAVACASKEEKEAQYEKEYKTAVKSGNLKKVQEVATKLAELYIDNPDKALELVQKWNSEVISDITSNSNQ